MTTASAAPPVLAAPAAAYGRGVALALAGALFWSLSGLLVRLADDASSWQIVLYRSLAMAATVLAILAVRYRGRLATPLRDAGPDALLAALALTGASSLFILSLAHVTVANALFMSGVAPFLTALVARAWLGEAIHRATWAAMLLAAAGVAVMVRGSLALDGMLLGNLLALGGAASFAMMAVFLRRGRQADMTPCVLWSGLLSAAIATAVLASGTSGAGFAVPARDLAFCLAMGVVQLGLGSVLYAQAARHLPAAPLQILALTELVMAPTWVWLAVGEVPAAATLAGGAMILAATLAQAAAGARGGRR